MVNHAHGWLGGWMGNNLWIWTVIGALVAVLLLIMIIRISRNSRESSNRFINKFLTMKEKPWRSDDPLA